MKVATMKTAHTIPPLAEQPRTHVDTATAAAYLGRAPDTLRTWSHTQSGPIRPRNVNGRLAWPVKDIRRVLGE